MLFISLFLILVMVFAYAKGVNVFDEFILGVKDGFLTVYKIAPYLLTMIFAIDIFRSSSALDFFINLLGPFAEFFNIPREILPMFLIKPLSGSGAIAVLTDISRQYGIDSKEAKIASVMMGSTETIFYTLGLYFGIVDIKKIRHTLLVALIIHFISTLIAVYVVCGIK
ncbi:spore maturation protein B [Caloramator fervidus]|uniref:Spore maturation protein B n=1 Tax=Caloramator fervidus TaxID=29344 RepID=A0A1H5RJW4_9CLOT|nr:nucleoside recognition domain-containing protein [Caloramator fervidus]SEF38540.1 spore maturation protein B [Caloramator fervidus]